jgi:hypothetical protein
MYTAFLRYTIFYVISGQMLGLCWNWTSVNYILPEREDICINSDCCSNSNKPSSIYLDKVKVYLVPFRPLYQYFT